MVETSRLRRYFGKKSEQTSLDSSSLKALWNLVIKKFLFPWAVSPIESISSFNREAAIKDEAISSTFINDTRSERSNSLVLISSNLAQTIKAKSKTKVLTVSINSLFKTVKLNR